MTGAPLALLFSFLMPLLLPTALVGVIFGATLVAVEWRRERGDRQPVAGWQRVPVFLCGAVAVIGLGALATNAIRGALNFHPSVVVPVGLFMLVGAPLFFWRSRWQGSTVGASTIAVSILAFITGFSIGVLFVPLVIAMVVVCFSYLRRPTQVDSPV